MTINIRKATESTPGVVKVGAGLKVDNGVVSVAGEGSEKVYRYYVKSNTIDAHEPINDGAITFENYNSAKGLGLSFSGLIYSTVDWKTLISANAQKAIEVVNNSWYVPIVNLTIWTGPSFSTLNLTLSEIANKLATSSATKGYQIRPKCIWPEASSITKQMVQTIAGFVFARCHYNPLFTLSTNTPIADETNLAGTMHLNWKMSAFDGMGNITKESVLTNNKDDIGALTGNMTLLATYESSLGDYFQNWEMNLTRKWVPSIKGAYIGYA